MKTNNETLKARGIFIGGIGLLLIGISQIISVPARAIQMWYLNKRIEEHTFNMTQERERIEQNINTNTTAQSPLHINEKPKFYILDENEKTEQTNGLY